MTIGSEPSPQKGRSPAPGLRWPLAIAWIGTGTALILGLWEGIRGLLGGASPVYDPMLALATVTVIGLVWYTYFTRETLEHARLTARVEEERRRKSIATAVLAELFGLTERLKNLNKFGPSAGTREFISHPMLERAAADPALFQPNTLQALAATRRRLKDVQEYLDRYPVLEKSSKDLALSSDARQNAEDECVTTYLGIKTRSGWAHDWAVRLVERLSAEGGVMPVGLGDKSVALFESVKLLDDPFDRTDS